MADEEVVPGSTGEIDAGTTLRFPEGAVLLASGPLRFAGSARQPVRLLPAADHWGGVLVREGGRCHWQHVEVGCVGCCGG